MARTAWKRKGTYGASSSKKRKTVQYEEKMPQPPKLLMDLKATKGVKVKEVIENQSVASSTITRIGTIAQGNTSRTRIGDAVIIKTIQLKVNARLAPQIMSADSVPAQVRCLVIVDKNMNGASPTLAELLDQPLTALSRFQSPIAFANKDRFVIIADKTMEMLWATPYLNNVGQPVCLGQIKTLNIYKVLNTQQTYSDAAANTGLAGNIYMFFQGLTCNNDPSTVTFDCMIKTRYTDPQ